MTGVRRAGRGSRIVPTWTVRCLVATFTVAIVAGLVRRHPADAADAKQTSKAVDPFLAQDAESPVDEIPAIPDDSRPDAKSVPKLERPRVTREIKKTAAPKLDAEQDADTQLPLELPGKRSDPTAGPSLKTSPAAGKKSDWRSKSLEPPSSREPKQKKANSVDPESARFERDIDIEDLTEPLAAIVIEGNKTIKTEEITKLLKTRAGRVLDAKLAREDVRTLHNKRWFFNVEMRIARSKQGPVLVFKVVERPMLQKVAYVGNKKIKEKALAELTGLKVGGPYDVGSNKESARRIESHYHEKGYLHAKVELEKGASPEEREVVFKIEEGPKVVVRKISFEGNKFVSGPVLKTQVKTKTQILWLFGGKYDPASVPEDVAALKQYYQNLGFFDVKVKPQENKSDDGANVHIKYVIDEGVHYKVGKIEFVGNQVIPEAKLLAGMKTHVNDYFNDRFVSADRDKIVAQYGELGRIFARVAYTPVTHEEPGFVNLRYEIAEDQPYRIGKIRVHINGDHPHTKESVVLTKLTFKTGELASMAKIEKSKQRLKNTQIFAGGQPGQQAGGDPPEIRIEAPDGSVPRRARNLARGQSDSSDASFASRPTTSAVAPAADPPADFEIFRGQNFDGDQPASEFGDQPLPGTTPGDVFFPEDEPPPYLDTDVYVSETQTGRIMFGVGVNSNMGLIGNATLQENNFDILRPPTSMQDILDGTAWRGGGQQFRLEAMPGTQLSRYLASWTDPYFLDQNVMLGVSGSYFTRFFLNWTEQRAGGNVRLGHQFTPLFSGLVTVKAESVRIINPSFPTPETVTDVLGSNFLSTTKFSLVHDTRDSAFLPGRGHYLEGSYEQGMANFVFPKFVVDGRQYFLVRERPDGGSRHIISLSGNFGWTGNQTPFFERFFAGGFNTIRGFAFYGITPREEDFRVGGFFQAIGSVEYLVPITADNSIQVVTFSDFGTVDSRVTLDAFRLSVGGGIRLTVPMMGPVPIAIDFAVPILRQSFDNTQVVSFNMGLLR